MLAGRISAGNAEGLATLVAQSDLRGQQQWLERAASEGRAAGCSRVLLSSEWLLGALAGPDRLRELEQSLSAAGAASVRLLLLLRDPVSQLISHYKHRAKGGTAGAIGDWALRDYHLPGRLAAIRRQIPESAVDLTVRGYRKEPGWLEQVFFRDWLDVELEPSSRADPVNPSLTLSELRLLRALRAERPGLVPDLYQRLIAVPIENKRESSEYETYACGVAASVVADYAEEWTFWNERLSGDERLAIPQSGPLPEAEPDTVELSNAQSQAIVELMADAAGLGFITRLFWRSRLRPLLSRVRRAVPGSRVD